MPQPHVLILRAPGTNCDHESAYAFEQAGATTSMLHVNALRESPRLLSGYQICCLPGGFSYGDDIAAGRILANQLKQHLAGALAEFRERDTLILGICNGFQILIKSGMLLPEPAGQPAATLTWNNSRKFEDRWAYLKTTDSDCVFLRDIDQLYLPVAHAEGKFVARDEATLTSLESQGCLPLRYTTVDGAEPEYPANPNGSQLDVAGVCDSTGRVFGLMPHPERHIDPTHHPRWTRGEGNETPDGLRIFQNAVAHFA